MLLSSVRSGILTIVAGLFFVPMTGCAKSPKTKHLTLTAPAEWRCPPGQACSGKLDYVAYVINSPQAELYLSFSGELRTPFSIQRLQERFDYGDLYLAEGEGRWQVISVQAKNEKSGSLRVVGVDDKSIHIVVSAPSYVERTEKRERNSDCRMDDVRGLCISERRVNQTISIELDLPAGVRPAGL